MGSNALVEIVREKNITVVHLKANSIIESASIEQIANTINKEITDNKPQNMVIDFTGVKFFSSQTLGILMDTWKKLHAYDARVVISGINPQLHRVFRITNLDKIFEFYESKDNAVEALIQN